MQDKRTALSILKGKKGICFEGGGCLGSAFPGALTVLYEECGPIEWTHVVGSSVGSIMATAIACKAEMSYIKDTLFNMDVKSFKDGGISGLWRFIREGGWYKGDAITEFMHQVLEEMVGDGAITFAELYQRTGIHLTITFMSMRYRCTRYADHITQPDWPIKEAVRASSSIAMFYKYASGDIRMPHSEELQFDYMTDGGTVDNLPIHVLYEQGLKHSEVLALKFMSTVEMSVYESDRKGRMHDYGLPSFPLGAAIMVVETLRNTAMKVHVHKEDWKICAKMNVGSHKATDFGISDEEIMELYEAGRAGMKQHMIDTQILLDKGQYPQ